MGDWACEQEPPDFLEVLLFFLSASHKIDFPNFHLGNTENSTRLFVSFVADWQMGKRRAPIFLGGLPILTADARIEIRLRAVGGGFPWTLEQGPPARYTRVALWSAGG